MKIQKVIFSCDGNDQYVGFWNSISNHFEKFLNLQTQLICLGEHNAKLFSDKHGEVKVVNLSKDYPPILQALWAKIWYTSQEPNTTWMVGDLDLYPLQKRRFLSSVDYLPDNAFAHLNLNGYGIPWKSVIPALNPGIPGYYHVGKGITFTEKLKFHDSFDEAIKYIFNEKKFGLKYQTDNPEAHASETSKRVPDWGWFCVEEHYCSYLLKDDPDQIIDVPIDEPYRRVDRFNNCQFDQNLLINGKYVDLHSLRPYEQYEAQIENLLSFVRDNVKD